MSPMWPDVDISSRTFWSLDPAQRDAAFAELRRERPVSWHPPGLWHPSGFWTVLRHRDILTLSPRSEPLTPAILSIDPPRRSRVGQLVHSVFTPQRVARLEQQIRNQAKLLVDALDPLGEVDFVASVSSELAARTLAEIFGLPEDLRAEFRDVTALGLQALWLVEHRRSHPGDDVTSALVAADIDGQRLSAGEAASFVARTWVAVTELTRQTASHAMKALCDFPYQRSSLMADFENRISPAIEEFLRWASPVLTSRRRATVDVEVGGRRIAAGDVVLLVYISGNRDEEAFTDPHRFDVTRAPNPHLAFGGGSPQLPDRLVRAQLQALFTELLYRLPDLQVGRPVYGTGSHLHAIERMPCRTTTAARKNDSAMKVGWA